MFLLYLLLSFTIALVGNVVALPTDGSNPWQSGATGQSTFPISTDENNPWQSGATESNPWQSGAAESNPWQSGATEESTLPVPSGFAHTLFVDEFTSYTPGSQLSTGKWTVDTGLGYPGGALHWGTNEVESYTNSKDNLIITPSGTLLITPNFTSDGWTSARIENTAGFDFSCAAGKKISIQASIKLRLSAPDVQMGIWPAFWTLGSEFRGNNDKWPAAGEIDILESVNGASKVWHTVHCGVSPGGPCDEKSGIGGFANLSRNQWHTLSVLIDRTNPDGDWRGERLVWAVDGVETFSVNGSRINDESAWKPLTNGHKFILFNVAVGGDFPNADAKGSTPTNSTQGGEDASLEVDWVAVYSS